MTTEPNQSAIGPSASTLAYIFADQFAKTITGGVGCRSLITGTVLDWDDLGETLVLLALWSLREAGAIAIAFDDGVHEEGTPIELVHVTGVAAIPSRGLEGLLLESLQTRQGFATKHWLSWSASSPEPALTLSRW